MNKKISYKSKGLPIFKIQKILHIFCFFLPLGFVKIGGISLSFFIFLFIIFIFIKANKKIFLIRNKTSLFVLVFFNLLVLSVLFAEDNYRQVSTFLTFKLLIQYYYWMALTLFLITWLKYLDLSKLIKYYSYGILVYIIFYYTLNPFIKLIPQNSFSFTLVVSIPLIFYYCFNRFNSSINVAIAIGLFVIVALSQSRTGTLIVFIELILLFTFFSVKFKKIALIGSAICLPIYMGIVGFGLSEDYKTYLLQNLEELNPRVAALISDPENVNDQDKSWLIRKLMVQKGLLIFEEHPFLGVGGMRFNDYWVEMDVESDRLSGSMHHYNKKSAHNSYIQILAEAGIFAFLIFTGLIITSLHKAKIGLIEGKRTFKLFIFTSVFGMAIYFYVVSAATGAITWFIFGLALASLNGVKKI